jgi:hypothetical protein
MGRPVELVDRLRALESERFDTSYLDARRSVLRRDQSERVLTSAEAESMTRAKVQSAVRAEKKRAAARAELIKKLYFNAGRYAGGARDETAQKAHALIMEES